MYEYALLPHLNIFSFDLLDYHYEEIHIFQEISTEIYLLSNRASWTRISDEFLMSTKNSSGETVQEALVDNRLKNN